MAVVAVVVVVVEAVVLQERQPGLGRGVVAVELRRLEREALSAEVVEQRPVVVGDKLRQPLWRA